MLFIQKNGWNYMITVTERKNCKEELLKFLKIQNTEIDKAVIERIVNGETTVYELPYRHTKEQYQKFIDDLDWEYTPILHKSANDIVLKGVLYLVDSRIARYNEYHFGWYIEQIQDSHLPRTVQAIQVNGDIETLRKLNEFMIPSGFKQDHYDEYLKEHKKSDEKLLDDFNAHQCFFCCLFTNRSGMRVEIGEWLVKHSDGTYEVLSDKEFRRRYYN